MERLFRLRNIEVYLGERFSLVIPQLDLQAGRIHVFHGSNGAGKSTLLHLLSFLLKPARGEIWFKGEKVESDYNRLVVLRKEVTLVEQSPYLFSGSVYHNLAFGLKIRGIRGQEKHRRIINILKTVGMKDFLKCNVRELSGGEAQRIALARALVLQPTVLLLDEPAANIDRDSLEKIEAVLSKLPAAGVTVIMSSHDEHQAERLNGDVITINNGRLVD